MSVWFTVFPDPGNVRRAVDNGNVIYQPAMLVPIGTDLHTSDNYETARELEERIRREIEEEENEQ